MCFGVGVSRHQSLGTRRLQVYRVRAATQLWQPTSVKVFRSQLYDFSMTIAERQSLGRRAWRHCRWRRLSTWLSTLRLKVRAR